MVVEINLLIISAWVKKTLGWVNPKNVTSNQNNVFLNNIENNKDMYILGINGSPIKNIFFLKIDEKPVLILDYLVTDHYMAYR